jgi:hypothetical protein
MKKANMSPTQIVDSATAGKIQSPYAPSLIGFSKLCEQHGVIGGLKRYQAIEELCATTKQWF